MCDMLETTALRRAEGTRRNETNPGLFQERGAGHSHGTGMQHTTTLDAPAAINIFLAQVPPLRYAWAPCFEFVWAHARWARAIHGVPAGCVQGARRRRAAPTCFFLRRRSERRGTAHLQCWPGIMGSR